MTSNASNIPTRHGTSMASLSNGQTRDNRAQEEFNQDRHTARREISLRLHVTRLLTGDAQSTLHAEPYSGHRRASQSAAGNEDQRRGELLRRALAVLRDGLQHIKDLKHTLHFFTYWHNS